MKRLFVVALSVLLVLTFSCKRAEKETQKAEKVTKSIEQFGKALEQTAKQMEESKGKVEAVDFRILKELLPEIKGWGKQNPRGEKVAFGQFATSLAEADYALGDAEVHLKITDPAGYYMFVAPFVTFIQSGYEEEDEYHYKKSGTFNGYPAIEEFYFQDKRGSLTVIVKNRFIVEAKGRNIEKINTLYDILNEVNLKKLESL